MRLVQLRDPHGKRRLALVEDDRLRLLGSFSTAYDAAVAATQRAGRLSELVRVDLVGDTLEYDPIHRGRSDWRLLPAFDHPEEPARCLVTGTGLTHRHSAEARNAMHATTTEGKAAPSHSLLMYQWGLEGGKPEPGRIGVAPEWFYKGSGLILKAHGETLDVPAFAGDGGEEAEVVGVYLVDVEGRPWRVGMSIGNEFSDHVTESKNYLYLAPSKLRQCAVGPELVVAAEFRDVRGTAWIERAGARIWSRPVWTGEANMSHTLANLEHHHFKYAAHRRPGDVHLHFLGADCISYHDAFRLEDGDEMGFEAPGFGRPLRNRLRVDTASERCIRLEALQ